MVAKMAIRQKVQVPAEESTANEAHSDLVRVEQARSLNASATSAAFINLANALILALAFRHEIALPILLMWLAFNAVYSAVLVLERKETLASRSPWPMRRVAIRATALGLVWGAFIWVMTANARPNHLLLVGVVMMGMTAGGAVRLAIVPAAAKGFLWSIATLSAAAAVVHVGAAYGGVPALLIVSYALFLQRYSRAFTALQFQYWRDRAELAARNETIGLLLNNFHDNSGGWVWSVNRAGRITTPSQPFLRAAGRSLIGAKFVDLFSEGDERDELIRRMERGEHFRELPVSIDVTGKRRHWLLAGGYADSGDYQGVATDVTDKVEAQERLAYLAHYDELTGLQNRVRFREEIDRALEEPHPGEVAVLFCLDLDRFKSINDSMGHPFGDALLAAVGARLRDGLGPEHIIARLGGDEFAILSRIPEGEWQTEIAGDRLLRLFDKHFVVGDSAIALNTSIGARVLGTAAEMSADEAMRDADLALYRAKAKGRGRCSVFHSEMTAHVTRRVALEQGLRTAVANRELSLAFQPYVEIATGKVIGFEALMRWHSPQFGPVSPSEFIPIAEESGLILSIGAWAIGEAIREASRWPKHVRVAVNLSPLQFQTQSLVQTVARELREQGFDPDRLELELTESTLLDGTDAALAAIQSLKLLGVRVALDDFGTGFSSLSYLRQFPFDKIKIDKSFVSEIASSATDASVVKAIIELGAALGMRITAEGVEDEGQLAALRALGCHEVQGYMLALPLPAAEARTLVNAAMPTVEPLSMAGAG
jgi:diguanylate cyclase (GGDEF)-like protein